jgi:AcrR family transcriptional regulator
VEKMTIAERRKSLATKRGRPRSQSAREAILKSTVELLHKVGFSALSMEGVAARAGVGKMTIYRWWPNRAALVAEAFLSSVESKVRFPDTGSIHNDLRAQMKELVKVFSSKQGRTIALLLGGGQSNPEMIEAFRSRWMEPRRVEAREIIRRAARRGELRPNIDADLALDALYGPIYFRFLVKHKPLDTKFIDALADYVVNGLCASK